MYKQNLETQRSEEPISYINREVGIKKIAKPTLINLDTRHGKRAHSLNMVYKNTLMIKGKKSSVITRCSICNYQGRTKVSALHSNCQNIACILICLTGCWCCCCLPFQIKKFSKYKHECGNCGSSFGYA
ncbi:unnamed protein product [Moneuplotes crassus]|uniref:LITAF domain-containing protein n=1 Tax=Euplotes crassus TaxID=5936 RepID=A0AAD1Y364_EUPCR|nr:unnamed protein product [Moneuplotes crassus]